jgi:hypothetical protein
MQLKPDESEEKVEPKEKSEVYNPLDLQRKTRVWILFVIIPIIISLVVWLLEYTNG